jgi:hypothetical protein
VTETAKRLRRLGLPHTRARAGAMLLGSAGVALGIAAAGLWLAPRAPAIAAAWLGITAVAAAAVWALRRAGRGADPQVVGRLLENTSNARAGSIVGTLAPVGGTPGDGASAELFALADALAARAVTAAAPQVNRVLARGTRRRLVVGAVAAAAGAALFVAASPASGRAAFWHPLRTIADTRAPVRLGVDRLSVRRGDTVTVIIDAPAATGAILWTRGLGEPWRSTPVTLDSAGRTVRRIGPLEADLYLRATSGVRRSDDRKISVAVPAFLATLELTARFPAYLQRTDEPVVPGPDTVLVPAGTAMLATGAASVALAGAGWVGSGERAGARLAVAGSHFSGRLVPASSGTWRLALAPADGSALEGDVPALHLRVVPDSAPVVSVPIPGRDTTLPITLRQPLVIDVRDDHGIARVEVVSWRVSQTGKVGGALRQALDASGAGDRALLQGELDADGRGLLPGDTLRFRVEAWDNAPAPHLGQSAEFALRLASMEELRAATRAATRDAAVAADSLAAAQRALSQRTADLAQERTRGAGSAGRQPDAGAQSGALSYEATERAEAIAQQQADLAQRAQRLAQAVEQVARAAQAAGLTDTAFLARLADVQRLLRQAITPELAQRLRELQEALSRLDSDATRDALQRLAEAQNQLREGLERSQELFRRAAVEGALASLAADAEDLRRRQVEWNGLDAARPDTAAAARERTLATRADSLTRGIAQVGRDLAQTAPPPDGGEQRGGDAALAEPRAAAARARAAMGDAARSAETLDAGGAASAGAMADSALAQVAEGLRSRRDSVAQAWRRETIDALTRALSETAALAAQQARVADALRNGEAGAATRSRQASVEEGTEAVARQVRGAAGRHALVSPQLDAALGLGQRQMGAARDALDQASPNLEGAATLADAAVDALNATAYALARSLSDVAGAQSGSGLAEALEQLTRLAGQQQGLNGATQGLLPLAGREGEAVLEQLRQLAAQQRALAEQLERLQAEGASQAAGPLAQEARDLARQLGAGRLDPQTIQRQERLYHRLLDAGRTLTGPEPDDQKQRTSRSPTGDSVHVPAALAPGATGSGPQLRYPNWDELAELTPEQRRLVLEYFRRINAPPVRR